MATQVTAEMYLVELYRDRLRLRQNFPVVQYAAAHQLVADEIRKVQRWVEEESTGQQIVTLRRRMDLPISRATGDPQHLLGRLLGPRGLTVRQMEMRTGCQITVKRPPEMQIAPPKRNFPPVQEPHVLLSATDTWGRAMAKLDAAEMEIAEIVAETEEIRNRVRDEQLTQLAVLNGTWRCRPTRCLPLSRQS